MQVKISNNTRARNNNLHLLLPDEGLFALDAILDDLRLVANGMPLRHNLQHHGGVADVGVILSGLMLDFRVGVVVILAEGFEVGTVDDEGTGGGSEVAASPMISGRGMRRLMRAGAS